MSTYNKHIKTILSIIMFEDGHHYHLNQYMIDDIDEFKKELTKALDYYSLPISADEIIIYEEIKTPIVESDDESDSEEDQQLGYGYE